MINKAGHLNRLFAAADILRSLALPAEDLLPVLLTLYGLKVLGSSAPLYHQLGLEIDPHPLWESIKRSGGSAAESLQNSLRTLRSEAGLDLLHSPYAIERISADLLSRAVLGLDKLDARAETPEDLLIVGEVVDTLISDRSSRTYRGADSATPHELNTLMAELLLSEASPSTVHDPVCGVGGSLAAVHTQLLKQGRDTRNVKFSGQDVSSELLFVCTWNLLLRGIVRPRLEQGDTLREPKFLDTDNKLERFDVVVANPPFNLIAHDDFGGTDPYQRFLYGEVSGRRSEYAFVQHVLASTKQDGRSVVVVAPGTLFRLGFEREIRENLVQADVIDACIGLPANLFQYTLIPTALMLFRSDKPQVLRGRVLFIDVAGDTPSKSRASPLTDDLRDRVLSAYRERSDQDGFSVEVTLDTIKEQDYNLLPKLYIPQPKLELPAIEELDAQIEVLEQQLKEARNQFVTALESLGE